MAAYGVVLSPMRVLRGWGCGVEKIEGSFYLVLTHERACRYGQSPLWKASGSGRLSSVEALILAKANVLQCGP